MKKLLVLALLALLAASLTAQESEKIMNLQKAYAYLPEEMLINETDLNCSYLIKDSMPRDIRIVAQNTVTAERREFSDTDQMVVNKGSRDGLKEGDLLLVLGEGPVVHHGVKHGRLGRYFQKKSLARITCLYETNAVVTLQKGCHAVRVGDFAIVFRPEQTLFALKPDYTSCRIPANAASGLVAYSDLTLGLPGQMAGGSQYVSVDLGSGVVSRGSYLLVYRTVASDLPPLIIGLGIVIHPENTNSTVKILDASSDIRVGDHVLVLPRLAAPGGAAPAPGGEGVPVVEAGTEGQGQPAAAEAAAAGAAALRYDILFAFDAKVPLADHAADYQAIREFAAGKADYLITLRGYTCSIGGDEYNLRLSTARVETIKAMLVSQYGIDPARIESYFYGEKEPPFDNSSEAERRKNRLVRIEVNGQ